MEEKISGQSKPSTPPAPPHNRRRQERPSRPPPRRGPTRPQALLAPPSPAPLKPPPALRQRRAAVRLAARPPQRRRTQPPEATRNLLRSHLLPQKQIGAQQEHGVGERPWALLDAVDHLARRMRRELGVELLDEAVDGCPARWGEVAAGAAMMLGTEAAELSGAFEGVEVLCEADAVPDLVGEGVVFVAVPLFITLIFALVVNVLGHGGLFVARSFKHKSIAGLLIRRGCDDDGSRLASTLSVQMHWNLGLVHEQRVLDGRVDHLIVILRHRHHTNRASNDAAETAVDKIRKVLVGIENAVRPDSGEDDAYGIWHQHGKFLGPALDRRWVLSKGKRFGVYRAFTATNQANSTSPA